MVRIRRANAGDSGGIAALIFAVWGQQVALAYIADLIDQGVQRVWIAEQAGAIGGFVAGFVTTAQGVTRWEVDLIGIHPYLRGQGLAPQLITHSLEDGVEHGAALARAIIRVENTPSQASFARVGFACGADEYQLYLWEGLESEENYPLDERLSVFPVETLTYRGLWLENLALLSLEDQRQAVRAARAQVAWEARANTGAFIAQDAPLAPDLRDAADAHSRSHWWTRRL